MDALVELQTPAVDVDSDTVTLEIDGVAPSPERDFTAVSEVVVRGI